MNSTLFLQALRAALPADTVLSGDDIPPQHHADWSSLPPVRPLALVRPHDTAEVAATLRLCNANGIAVVPQGGLTGLAGGAIPHAQGIALSLERLNHIEGLDPDGATLTLQAGVTLQQAQEAAAAQDLQLGVDLAPRGSCQIGGLIATNAGGLGVIQYGTMRAQVLGLEVVLADGSILPMLRALPKNNTGYDLSQFFIGSEGSLGVITRAVLRLYPRAAASQTALLALPDFAAALKVLDLLRRRLPDRIAAFELMWRDFLDAVRAWVPVNFPFATTPPLAALIQVSGADDAQLAGEFEAVLGEALEQGWVLDAVLANSLSQHAELWRLRECVGELFAQMQPINFDLSLPVARADDFANTCRSALETRWPGLRALYFGHLGDGNLHIIADAATLPAGVSAEEVEALIYALLPAFDGAISAEHGIGSLRPQFLHHSRSPTELAAMRAIKRALDPSGILNPGKIFSSTPV